MDNYYWSDKLFEEPREFIGYFLQDSYFRTGCGFDASLTGKAGWIFRGQSDANWELRSSAFRPGGLDNFAPQPPRYDDDPRRELVKHLHAEAKAVSLFLENADRMGIPTPLDYTNSNHALNLIFSALINKDYEYIMHFPIDALQRATALAQHHGVPTRFLDWTESPLIASYFAAFGASSFSETPPDENQEISVIYMSSLSLSKESSPVELVMAPRHENTHLRQQKGVFTNIKNANKFFIEKRLWPTLNDFPGELQLHRVRLSAVKADQLLRELFDLDITRHSLMPSLANSAIAYKYVKVLFSKFF